MSELVKVNMADFKVSRDPSQVLIALGLGSCVGIAMYDPIPHIAGLLHIMLPYAQESKNPNNPKKFADTGIPLLINKMLEEGAQKERLIVKIAGGAQMFAGQGLMGNFLDIGSRNVESTRKVCQKAGLNIAAEDVGGNFGRSLQIAVASGKVSTRTIGKEEVIL